MKTILIFMMSVAPVLAAPFQATGFKVGEVTDTTAIVWTRLTAKVKPNPATAPALTFQYANGETYQPDLKNRPKHPRSRVTGVYLSILTQANVGGYLRPTCGGSSRIREGLNGID